MPWINLFLLTLAVWCFYTEKVNGNVWSYANIGMMMNAGIMLIVKPIIVRIYSSRFKRKENLLSFEKKEENIMRRGEIFSMKICRRFFLFMCVSTVLRVRWFGITVSSDKEIVTTFLIPAVLFIVLLVLKFELPKNKIADKLRKTSLDSMKQLNIWLVIRKKEILFESQLKNNGREGCLILLEDMKVLLGNKVSEEEIKRSFRRCCYMVQVDKQEELDKICEEIYQEHLNTFTDGLRKIVIVNKTVAFNDELQMSEKYKNHEFIYYKEFIYTNDLNYKFLARVCGDNLDGFKVKKYKSKRWKSLEEKKQKLVKDAEKSFDYNSWKYFEHSMAFIEVMKQSADYPNEVDGANPWLANFYNSACVFQNPTRAVMAMLDYWELLFRLESIYYYKITGEKLREKDLVHSNLMNMARFLLDATKEENQKHYEILKNKKFDVPVIISVYIRKLREFMYIQFQGEQVSFLGLVSLIQMLRNKVVAHGILDEENVMIVWGITFWAVGLLNSYMQLSKFQLNAAGETYEIGFEKTILAERLIINHQNSPCIASIVKSNGKGYIYVDFFGGELITPKFVDIAE